MTPTETTSGLVVVLPWVTLKEPCELCNFRFVPVLISDPTPVFGEQFGDTIRIMLSRYVDIRAVPIQSCTAMLHGKGPRPWDLANLKDEAWLVASMLAFVGLAQQRFFDGWHSPHINASIFRAVQQGVTAGVNGISLVIPRRDGAFQGYGYKFEDITFQMPIQAHQTECPSLSAHLLDGLTEAWRSESATWLKLLDSVPLFLMANAETLELQSEQCTLLSAIAFERLLCPPKSDAFNFSEAFAELWRPFGQKAIGTAPSLKVDPDGDGVVQASWFIHQKWAKELYERRSAAAHRGTNPKRSQNWLPWQHVVIAAFAFPLTVKLLLSRDGLYTLNNRELGACEALDHLLERGFGQSDGFSLEWPSVLSEHEIVRDLTAKLYARR